jgi:LysM repeat protein
VLNFHSSFKKFWRPVIAVLFVSFTAVSVMGTHAVSRLNEPTGIDSVGNAEYIARNIRFKNRYTWLHYDQNYLEFEQPGALAKFFYSLRTANRRKVRVVHIGDSHVQADIFTGYIRNRMQEVFGKAGRGMIFPFNIARTHDAYDYQSYAYGYWTSSRNIALKPQHDLGLSGVTGRTTDPNAGFRIAFNRFYNRTDDQIVRIYCAKTANSFDVQLRYNLTDAPIVVKVHSDTLLPYVTVRLPEPPQMLELKVLKRDTTQTQFELYGLQLETAANQGVLYSSIGINGAGLGSVIRQNLMPYHLRDMKPDLVVLDLSGNEYYMGGLNPVEFGGRLRTLIGLLREASPDVSILVSCSQDIYRGYYNISACGPAAKLARDIALEMGCAFYDYYRASGGQYSMLKWRMNYLANPDRVHLSYEGYLTKGELYTNALLNSYYLHLKGYSESPHQLDSTQLAVLPKPIYTGQRVITAPNLPSQTTSLPTVAATPHIAPTIGTKIVHIVTSGQTIGQIAEAYGVRASSIMSWNGLAGTLIRIGQKLLVFSPTRNTPVGTANTAVATPPKTSGTTLTHTVQKGETLWSIAKKYSTTIEAIQKLNKIPANLPPGTKLRVR